MNRSWDFEQYLRIAIPYLEILEGLYGQTPEYFHFSHEYMGMPAVLSVLEAGKKDDYYFCRSRSDYRKVSG